MRREDDAGENHKVSRKISNVFSLSAGSVDVGNSGLWAVGKLGKRCGNKYANGVDTRQLGVDEWQDCDG